MALENAKQIIACANHLSQCASAARSRLLELMKKDRISDQDISKIQGDINAMNQKSDELVMDAIELSVGALEVTQAELESVLENAKGDIEEIQDTARFVDLMANMVAFSTAIITRKPKAILASFKDIRDNLQAIG